MNDIELLDSLSLIPSIDSKQIEKITKRLPEYRRTKSIIGHSTSQTEYTLLTLNMINDSPMSRMKQCMAQIDRRFRAVQEAFFDIEKKKLEIKELSKNKDKLSEIKIRELDENISITNIDMASSLRQIGMFQDMYESIRENNNIPKQWNESDYEEQEYQNMVRKSFRLGIQELTMTGRISKSAVEWWEQLGIHPQVAEAHCRKYHFTIQDMIEHNNPVTVEMMYKFLDNMADLHKDCYQFVLKRLGLKEVGSKYFRAKVKK